jgi:hypothetical protein
MNRTFKRSLPAFSALALALAPTSSHALDQISRVHQSFRSAGMGGVRITTGLYDDNFFSNPARVTANPASKFVFLQTGIEVANISNVSSVASAVSDGGDYIKALGDTAGKNTHIRVQEQPFGFFLSSNENRKWALGVALFSTVQADIDLRRNFQVGAQGIVDVGPAATFGYKFLEDKLSVGTTAHLIYRFSSNNFSFLDLLKGRRPNPQQNGGQGMMIDFDLGATYELPILQESPFKLSVGASVNNILGGTFTNLGDGFIPNMTCTREDGTVGPCGPVRVSRSLSIGTALTRKTWGVFSDTSFAFEVTDFGNNSNDVYAATPKDNPGQDVTSSQYGSGSLFRMIHLGMETHWKLIALRAGLNQGYLAGGIGLDLRFFTLDFATYGEEMSLTSGGIEDRRYAVQFGFQI